MLKIEFTGQFKRDFKLAVKRGCDREELMTVISILASEQPLPEKYKVANGEAMLNACIFKVDDNTNRVIEIKRITR